MLWNSSPPPFLYVSETIGWPEFGSVDASAPTWSPVITSALPRSSVLRLNR